MEERTEHINGSRDSARPRAVGESNASEVNELKAKVHDLEGQHRAIIGRGGLPQSGDMLRLRAQPSERRDTAAGIIARGSLPILGAGMARQGRQERSRP